MFFLFHLNQIQILIGKTFGQLERDPIKYVHVNNYDKG